MRAVDSHAHLDFPQYDPDRDQLIAQLQQSEIGVINVATDLPSIERVDQLSRQHPLIWGAIGIHPTDVGPEMATQLPSIINSWPKLLAANPKLVAIGEIGLDYVRNKDASLQKAALREMLVFAQQAKKPVIFHCREAYGDLLTMLTSYAGITGVVHCFSGDLTQAKGFIELGLHISFTANITYPMNQHLRDVVKGVDINHLLIETDSPFLPPQAIRGQRNDPRFVTNVAQGVAEVKGLTLEQVLAATTANAVQLFGLTG